jgi:hypothetical protein
MNPFVRSHAIIFWLGFAALFTALFAPTAVAGNVNGVIYQQDGTTPLTSPTVQVGLSTGDPCGGFSTLVFAWNSDVNGSYTIAIPGPGTYFLHITNTNDSYYIPEYYHSSGSTPDCAGAGSIVVSGDEDVNDVHFQLDLGGWISGTVTEEGTGSTLSDIGINLFTEKCGQPSPGAMSFPDGTYSILYLQPGQYYLQNWGGGYLSEWWTDAGGDYDCNNAQAISVTAGATTSPVNFIISQGGTISGYVKDTSGNPIADVCVDATSDRCDGSPQYLGGATSDGSGYYEIGGLVPGTQAYLSTNAQCNGLNFIDEWWEPGTGTYDCTMAQPVTVSASDIDFSLTPGSTIRGRVTNATGQGLDDVCVNAFYDPCGDVWAAGVTTDSNGDYQFDGLLPDDYFIGTDVSCSTPMNYYNEWYNDVPFEDCGGAVPVTLGSEQTIDNINFALDAGFEMDAAMIHVHQPPDGSHPTDYLGYEIEIDPFGFAGDPQTDIDTISVEDPDGVQIFTKADFTFDSQWNTWFLAVDGSPANGLYTFTVTAGGISETRTDFQYVNRSLPLPDTAEFKPANGATLSSMTPSFSWDLIEFPGIPLYYSFEIKDDTDTEVYAVDGLRNLTHCTLPAGQLMPGQTYQWRVTVADAPDWLYAQNSANSPWQTVHMAATLTADELPAISPTDWNVVTWTTRRDDNILDTDLLVSAAIIDHDGVAIDGSSHDVWVQAPNDTEWYQLNFDYSQSPTIGYYEGYYDIDNNNPPTGAYTLKVEDLLGGGISILTDDVNGSALAPPVADTITPNNRSHFITATFDDVYVNGALVEDFNGVGTIGELDGDIWDIGSASNANVVGNKLEVDVGGSIGRGHGGISFTDPAAIESVAATIQINNVDADPNAPPRARIAGTFFNEGGYEVFAHISVKRNRVYYGVSHDFVNEQETSAWIPKQSGDLMTVATGQAVPVSIEWDPIDEELTFDADGNTAVYTPTGPVYPAINPGMGLHCRIDLNIDLSTDATRTFSYDAVPTAERHRLRIYNSRGGNVWRQYVGTDPTTIVPPGALKPNASYRFRVEGFDAPNPMPIDHVAKTPRSSSKNYIFYTGNAEAQAPHIDLDNSGVAIWTDGSFGSYLDFWIAVHDAQGVPGDIKSVKVRFPSYATSGIEEEMYYDNISPTATRGFYRRSSTLPIESGSYTFVVEDQAGNVVTRSEALTVNPIGFPDLSTFSRVINDVDPENQTLDFAWETVIGAEFYRVEIYDQDFNAVYRLPTTTNSFRAPLGLFKDGALYRWRITTRREFFSENQDNASSNPRFDAMPTFVVNPDPTGSAAPTIDIEDVGVTTMRVLNPTSGLEETWLVFQVKVTDADGVPGDIASVMVSYPPTVPGGPTTRELPFEEMISDTEGRYEATEVLSAPAANYAGIYGFTVTDHNASPNTAYVEDTLVVNVLDRPQNVTPPPDTNIYGTSVTIEWDDVNGAARYKVRLYDGFNGTIHWSPYIGDSSYELPDGLLEVGQTYSFRVYAYREPEPDDIDNFSMNTLWHSLNHHFTILPVSAGDLNLDGNVDVLDAILALQVLAGLNPAGISLDGDANGDGVIGLAEVLAGLQGEAVLRN